MKNKEHIIHQEERLLDRTEPAEDLIALIDDDFTEIGSSGSIYDKADVIASFLTKDEAIRVGSKFSIKELSQDILLVTYISSIKESAQSPITKALRSSIWQKREGTWRMIFHQGTPVQHDNTERKGE